MTDQISPDQPPPSLNKACEACRSVKVRCLPAIVEPSPICQRCIKTNRRCVFAPPQRKTNRKRTDARVAELEKEMQAMRALLNRTHHMPEEVFNKEATSTDATNSSLATFPPNRTSSGQSSAAATAGLPILDSQTVRGTATQPINVTTTTAKPDIVDRGLVSMETVIELFESFKNRFASQYAVVVFPEGYTVNQLRHEKPILFLAVMATASGMAHPELYSTLNTEAIQEYANLLMVGGEKSLELVQAMIMTAVWYFPIGKWSALRFYEYVHFASTMAIEIGLGEPLPRTKQSSSVPVEGSFFFGQGVNFANVSNASQQVEVERERTLLVCYVNCVCVSLSLRRPNLLQFTARMFECATNMETSPFTLPIDIPLIALVKLLNMAEEISSTYALTDGARRTGLSENHVSESY